MLVACWSPKGGVGRSLLAAGLAYRFQQRGLATVLVDLDPQKADLATMLQAPARPSVADWHLLAGGPNPVLPDAALVPLKPKLHLLPGPSRLVEESAVTRDLAERLVAALNTRGGVAVADLCTQLRDSTMILLEQADRVLLTITPDLLATRAAYAFVREMHLLGLDTERFQLVVNRAGTRSGLSLAEIIDLIDLPVAAELPSAPAVAQAVNRGEGARVLAGRNPFTRALGTLAGSLIAPAAGPASAAQPAPAAGPAPAAQPAPPAAAPRTAPRRPARGPGSGPAPLSWLRRLLAGRGQPVQHLATAAPPAFELEHWQPQRRPAQTPATPQDEAARLTIQPREPDCPPSPSAAEPPPLPLDLPPRRFSVHTRDGRRICTLPRAREISERMRRGGVWW